MVDISSTIQSSIEPLRRRWKGAREAAVFKFTGLGSEDEFFDNINIVSDEDFESVVKELFLNSRKLGLGYQRANQLTWERDEFVQYLPSLGSPCAKGAWLKKEKASVLVRGGCINGTRLGTRYCQYWREAFDGLVLGLSEDVGYVRHSSIGAGDARCEDIIYDDEASPTDAIWTNPYRWGELPVDMRSDLHEIEKRFDDLKIDLKFLGVAEQNLFYKLEPKENLTCGSAGTIYRSHLEKIVKEKFPNLRLKDASPVAVYGEKA